MSRSEFRPASSRPVAPVKAAPVSETKIRTEDPFLTGMWWVGTDDGDIVSLDQLDPSRWPPNSLFIRPGRMSRADAALLLEAIAYELREAGANH